MHLLSVLSVSVARRVNHSHRQCQVELLIQLLRSNGKRHQNLSKNTARLVMCECLAICLGLWLGLHLHLGVALAFQSYYEFYNCQSYSNISNKYFIQPIHYTKPNNEKRMPSYQQESAFSSKLDFRTASVY